jgi:hypothetical protein
VWHTTRMTNTARVTQITVRELLDTDVIVQNPASLAPHAVRYGNLLITRQKYGITYLADHYRDDVFTGRVRGCFKYSDKVWTAR